MKSKDEEFIQTQNLAIFDKHTALNLAMSLKEISSKPCHGINLYSPASSRNTSIFSTKYDVQNIKSGKTPVGIFNGSSQNYHRL